MIRVVRVAAVLLCLVSGAVATDAQSVLGTIRGTLYDPQGQPVARAAIRAIDENTRVLRAVETDARGNYEIPNLRAGTYRVEDNSPGFVAFSRTGIVLRASETARVDLRVAAAAAAEVAVAAPEPAEPAHAPPPPPASATPPAPAAPAVRVQPGTQVVVTAEGGSAIQLESPSIQTGLDYQQLSNLPRGGRDFQDFLYLDANVTGHYDALQAVGGRSYGFSYLQDGQPSNGVLFGILTNASPGLEAIDEVKVLSNAYAAEFGGLGAVLVTSRRGNNRYSGTAFYDGNWDELNALTYPQKQAGLERGFPGSNTTTNRFGASFSGPIAREKTFFFANYEGRLSQDVVESRLAIVPTEEMRAGDFSAASFVIRDPLTGRPFPGNVIPADRISPEATRILDFYYPVPNLPTLPSGLGRYQSFPNLESTRHRGDLRIDHELSRSDSLFVRFSLQYRNPGTFFEDSRLPNLGVTNRELWSETIAGSWVRIFSSTALNELRIGYNVEESNRRSNHKVGATGAALGISVPTDSQDRWGYPALLFSGANAISGVTDNSTVANRDQRQSSFSVSDTFTWLKGRHTVRLGGLYSRNIALDGYSLGVNGAGGRYSFTGRSTGNSLGDLLLGLPAEARSGATTRGTKPLDVMTQTFAGFVQDDWTVGSRLTLFLGLRYEVTTPFIESNDFLLNFEPDTGRVIVPSEAALSSVTVDPALYPAVVASDLALGRALVRTDYTDLSPRAGFAWRLDDRNLTVLRGGFGYFYPTAAAQGMRDVLSRFAFRSASIYRNPRLTDAFQGQPSSQTGGDIGVVDFDIQNPRFAQYNLTLERELPGGVGLRATYFGLWKTRLVMNRFTNSVPASTVPFDPSNPEDLYRLPYPHLTPGIIRIQNAGDGYLNALQLQVRRRPRQGLALDLAYTLASSRSDAPDVGNSSLGIVQYDPYDLSKMTGPDTYIPRHRFVANVIWDLPFGHGRSIGATMPGWANVLVGGWTLSAIVQARSGYHLTPFYRGVDSNGKNPANTGIALTDNSFSEAWRPDTVADPAGGGSRDNFYNLAAFQVAAPGTTGNTPFGVIEGPSNWVVNLGAYKDLYRGTRVAIQFRATFDNAFNHPQFLVLHDSAFLDLTDYVVNGLPTDQSNGLTNTLTEVGSLEGFAAGRVIRLGVRVQF